MNNQLESLGHHLSAKYSDQHYFTIKQRCKQISLTFHLPVLNSDILVPTTKTKMIPITKILVIGIILVIHPLLNILTYLHLTLLATFSFNNKTTTTVTTSLWPFVRDYLGEPVPEEIFTDSHLS